MAQSTAPQLDFTSNAAVNATVGSGCRIEGSLKLSGLCRFNGELEGSLVADGDLTVEKHGVVRGNVHARSLYLQGRVDGNISCSERLELLVGAKVVGDIAAPVLVIQDGVLFEGNCQMKEPDE